MATVHQPPENQIFYSLEQGRTGSEWFNIDTFTGVVTINKMVSLDQAIPNAYIVSQCFI